MLPPASLIKRLTLYLPPCSNTLVSQPSSLMIAILLLTSFALRSDPHGGKSVCMYDLRPYLFRGQQPKASHAPAQVGLPTSSAALLVTHIVRCIQESWRHICTLGNPPACRDSSVPPSPILASQFCTHTAQVHS